MGCSPAIFIVGPTAVGKTSLSVRLARRLKAEIISADSMQVYKGMSTLSQAPAPSERKGIKHHLVAFLNPSREYSAASFRKEAARIMDSATRRGKIPIVVGGSGLYVKSLIDGLFPSPEADLKFRSKMENYASKYGTKKLHAKLAKVDPEAAGKIHPNDKRRVIRALEVYQSTGETMTELKCRTKGLKDHYDMRIFALIRRREEIYSAIDRRVEKMFDGGVLNEVKRLRKKRLSKTARAVLGLEEIAGYLDGKYDLDTAKSLFKMNTRRFAKRQLTWFRADGRIVWFDISKFGEKKIVDKITELVKRKG